MKILQYNEECDRFRNIIPHGNSNSYGDLLFNRIMVFASLEQGLQISVSVWNRVYFLPIPTLEHNQYLRGTDKLPELQNIQKSGLFYRPWRSAQRLKSKNETDCHRRSVQHGWQCCTTTVNGQNEISGQQDAMMQTEAWKFFCTSSARIRTKQLCSISQFCDSCHRRFSCKLKATVLCW